MQLWPIILGTLGADLYPPDFCRENALHRATNWRAILTLVSSDLRKSGNYKTFLVEDEICKNWSNKIFVICWNKKYLCSLSSLVLLEESQTCEASAHTGAGCCWERWLGPAWPPPGDILQYSPVWRRLPPPAPPSQQQHQRQIQLHLPNLSKEVSGTRVERSSTWLKYRY